MRFCVVTGCEAPASLTVVSPVDGATVDVCSRCAEELIAVWGYRPAVNVDIWGGVL